MSNDLLLVGGTGFVGKRLLPRVANHYDHIHVVARAAPAFSLPDNCSFYPDVQVTPVQLVELLCRCQTVLTLASATTPGSSARFPSIEVRDNLLPLASLLEAAQGFDDLHIVYVSSGGTIYGNAAHMPARETSPASPLSYYGAGKAAAESFLHAYSVPYGRPVTIIRPSNFYGPGQEYRKGFGVIRTIFEHLRNGSTLEIWGDGESRRDYLYIDDFIDACVLVVNGVSPSGLRTFNVGSGISYSINDICGLIERITHKSIPKIYRPSRAIDLREIVLDATAFRETYRWKPCVTIDVGLSRTWEWLINPSSSSK